MITSAATTTITITTMTTSIATASDIIALITAELTNMGATGKAIHPEENTPLTEFILCKEFFINRGDGTILLFEFYGHEEEAKVIHRY